MTGLEMGITIWDQMRNCPAPSIFADSMMESGTVVLKNVRQIVTLNGWLLPPARETKAFPMGVHPVDLYRSGSVILYDEESMQGIEVRRSFRQIFVFFSLYVRSLWLVCTKYGDSRQKYQAEWASLHGMEYWRHTYER